MLIIFLYYLTPKLKLAATTVVFSVYSSTTSSIFLHINFKLHPSQFFKNCDPITLQLAPKKLTSSKVDAMANLSYLLSSTKLLTT
jgi:hypothetical protein